MVCNVIRFKENECDPVSWAVLEDGLVYPLKGEFFSTKAFLNEGKEEAFLIALKSSSIDLEKIDSLTDFQLKEIDLFNANKKYSKTREEEIFDLLNKGCAISEGALYYQMKKLVG